MPAQPNILWIMADDHGANAMGAYGSRLAGVMPTPHIDRIGREGCVAEGCFCTNALCSPSRATILTGTHSHVNGVKTLVDPLPPGAATFPKLLQAAGYETCVVGKWHLHGEPEGFDHYSVLPAQGVYWDPCFLRTGFDWRGIDLHNDRLGTPERGYVTDLITDQCLDWLRGRGGEKPFLLLCHHKAPHDEFEYHPRYEHLLDGVEIPEPESLWREVAGRSAGSRGFGGSVSPRNPKRNLVETMSRPDYPTGPLETAGLAGAALTRAAYQKYIRDYLRCVKGIDDSVGRLLDYLDAAGLAENTLVVYTSDQGMLLGEHDFTDKRWFYEESARMPLLLRYPAEIPTGRRMERLVSNLDFAPLLLDYAGVDIPGDMQGKSFRGLLSGESAAPVRESLYYHYWLHLAHLDVPAHLGVRTERYKLVFFYGLPLDATGALQEETPTGWELYDLEADPNEMRNLYGDPAYGAVQARLHALLERERAEKGETGLYPQLDARCIVGNTN